MISTQLRKIIENEWKKITLKKINEIILSSLKNKSDVKEIKKEKFNIHDRVKKCF